MLTKGSKINEKYELMEFVAPGGMGEVWKAKDLILNRNVALKFVNAHYVKQNPKAEKILLDEAIAAASLLGHPNAIAILDFNKFTIENGDNYYIAMEFVDGVTVEKWIDGIKPTIDAITYYNISLLISLHICRAIEYAHKEGIQHRDIKPLNVFLSKHGLIKVGDFGIAKFIDEATRTHTVKDVSSPGYTAPEQWKGEKQGISTDIYQLGCTLYHILTGRLPFTKNSIAAMAYAHLNDVPARPNEISNIISEQISDIIMKLIEKEKDERPSIWEVVNVIANEIQKPYKLNANFTNKKDEEIKKIYEITEIDMEKMKKSIVKIDFPDYSEVLSEGIQLILSGVKEFKILK
ncbi:serine/threonine protein kinase [Clostridiaceae bacterium UIB06]|uniref:non-specific serine/threonine protein kinase n=1 Tax=Clostridium thailandense TaxID=2794346 RepID=A0A949TPA8_9CLOT|nr:serine/threonine-protein kinase [Clostridium thailandense]MBV7276060.1 serine/threonine protein kinase [Clostridium thailandense]MCH5135835.1 serine/threonine protein kinase [Clostridiaceae bacterium UIB06]